ncbi:MAG: VPA1262 family N-terminal domain-containing protein [Acidiferrobacter sp.]
MPEGVALNKEKRQWCYVRQVSMPVDEAITWYEDALKGHLRTPVDREVPPIQGDAQEVETGGFDQEPLWPYLLVRSDLPFQADWHGTPRVHQAIAMSPIATELEELMTHPTAAPWLCDHLFFDLAAHPEWLGGMALIAPNPVARRIERRRVLPTPDSHERTLIRVYPRTGADISTLSIVSWERRGLGYALWTHRPLTDPWTTIEHPYDIREEGLAVICTERGLLHWEEPASYLKQVNVTLSIKSGQRNITVQNGPGQAAESYAVDDVKDETVTVGQAAVRGPGFQRLDVLEKQRNQRDSADHLGQKWFHGDPQEARDFVRSLIGGARQRAMIVDPYFATPDLFSFIPAATRRDVRTSVLTSADVMRSHVNMDTEEERGEHLLRHIQAIDKRLLSALPEIRVMVGKGAIHDRFVVIDDTVWFLGNSLNAIGERAGMMIRLPGPAPVIRNLEVEFSKAELLTTWVEKRFSARGASE